MQPQKHIRTAANSTQVRTQESDEGAPELTSWEKCIARVEGADDSEPEFLRIKTAVQALQNQAGRGKQARMRTNEKNGVCSVNSEQ